MFIINFILQILPVAVNNCKPFRQKNQPLCFSCVLNVFCTIFKSDKIIIFTSLWTRKEIVMYFRFVKDGMQMNL